MVYESHPEGVHLQAAAAAGPARGDDDGGLWGDGKRLPPLKLEEGQWDPANKVGEVATDVDGRAPSAAGQGVSSFTFVFIVLAFGAIFVVWKRSPRRNRRRN